MPSYIGSVWFLAHKDMNRLMHALDGNILAHFASRVCTATSRQLVFHAFPMMGFMRPLSTSESAKIIQEFLAPIDGYTQPSSGTLVDHEYFDFQPHQDLHDDLRSHVKNNWSHRLVNRLARVITSCPWFLVGRVTASRAF
eukprot:m.167046 g.167046  ORF g.167046 m.167046 type:complete len:140 (+) comp25032_c0_seq1:409-828(+)